MNPFRYTPLVLVVLVAACTNSQERIIRKDAGVEKVIKCDGEDVLGDVFDRLFIPRLDAMFQASIAEAKTDTQRIAATRLKENLDAAKVREKQWRTFLASMKSGDSLYRVFGHHEGRRFEYFVIYRADQELDRFSVIDIPQNRHNKPPNQAPEPTPTTVTPPAGQEARQP